MEINCSYSYSKMPVDAWTGLEYHFTQNAPKNLLEEAQTASQLAEITSRKTQLSIISAVQDIQQEIAEIVKKSGKTEDSYRTDRINADVFG